MSRELYTAVDMDDFNGGIVFAFILGVMYMLVFVYYIYKKFLSIIFEDLICLLDVGENEELYRPIVYSGLNSILFLIFCFFSTFSSQTDLGLSAIIGSDVFNIFVILGLIFYKFKDAHHGDLDIWITFRDSFVYLLGLIALLLFLIIQWINIFSAIILIVFYVFNYFVLANNQDIKDKVMELMGLNNEDNEFNSDEHFQCRKRRESSTVLREMNCFGGKDINLQKKLNRMEALLVLRYKTPDHPKKIIYARFQKSVYQVIYGIKSQITIEREKRTEAYQAIYKPKEKKMKNQEQMLQPQEALQNDNGRNDSQSKQEQQVEDEDPLIHKMDENNNDQNENQVLNQIMYIKKDSEHKIQDNKDNNTPSQNNIDEAYNEGGVSLKMPKTLFEKILFIMFYPIFLIMYLQPNYLENPVPKKLVLCSLLNIILLCGCLFLIDWWLYEIARGTGIPTSILGLLVGGIFLNFHFIEYNLKVAKEEKQLEFVQSFFQIGICKVSLCPGIPWLLNIVVKMDIDVVLYSCFGFAVTVGIFALMILLFLLIAISARFKLGSYEGQKLGALYFIFILTSIIIIGINIGE